MGEVAKWLCKKPFVPEVSKSHVRPSPNPRHHHPRTELSGTLVQLNKYAIVKALERGLASPIRPEVQRGLDQVEPGQFCRTPRPPRGPPPKPDVSSSPGALGIAWSAGLCGQARPREAGGAGSVQAGARAAQDSGLGEQSPRTPPPTSWASPVLRPIALKSSSCAALSPGPSCCRPYLCDRSDISPGGP